MQHIVPYTPQQNGVVEGENCTTEGIQMQYTIPYTPQQNGIIEIKNYTLKEMDNFMIQSKGLSIKY